MCGNSKQQLNHERDSQRRVDACEIFPNDSLSVFNRVKRSNIRAIMNQTGYSWLHTAKSSKNAQLQQ